MFGLMYMCFWIVICVLGLLFASTALIRIVITSVCVMLDCVLTCTNSSQKLWDMWDVWHFMFEQIDLHVLKTGICWPVTSALLVHRNWFCLWLVCVFVCLCVCLSVCLFVYLSICVSMCVSPIPKAHDN